MSVKEKMDEVRKKTCEFVDDRKRDVQKFYYDHEVAIKRYGPAALIAAVPIIRSVIVSERRNAEIRDRDTRHYDRSTNEYYYSKRKLNKREQDKMDELVRLGYTKGEALDRLGLRR